VNKAIRMLGALVAILALSGAASIHAGNKVKVCHVPPGNPDSFHTITVSENALQAHLSHGDLAGSCFANAEALCDDGNACTIDGMDPDTETCLADHPPVDCDDSNLCTNDTCDPADGCQSAPIICDDEDLCTVDICNPSDGQCTGTPIDCGALGVCLPGTGLCDFPCDGFACDPSDQCHEAGNCVLSGGLPECIDGDPLADGTSCDDGDAGTSDDVCTGGVCAGSPVVMYTDACPCYRASDLEALPMWGPTELDLEASYCQNQGGVEGGDALVETSLTGEFYVLFIRYGSQRYCQLKVGGETTLINPLNSSAVEACKADLATVAQQRGYTCFD